MIIRKLLIKLAKFLCKHRGNSRIESIVDYTDIFYRKLNNVNFDFNSNGELRVLDVLSKYQLKIVFDVGANIGEWSRLLLSRFNQNDVIRIYAFEIVPETFSNLQINISGYTNIRAINIGLSDKSEELKINIGNNSVTATACKIDGMPFHNQFYKNVIVCKTMTGIQFLQENNISHIDFLKIDVEGMDLKVIKGFADDLKKVRVIQFEYGVFNISSHDLLIDFYNYFLEKGFVVGKIFPTHVDFFEYHFTMENFHGGNFLAVRNDEINLIKELSNEI